LVATAIPPAAYPAAYPGPPIMRPAAPVAPPARTAAPRRRRGFLVGLLVGFVIVFTAAFLAPRFANVSDSPSPATTSVPADNPTGAVDPTGVTAHRGCIWSAEGFSNVRSDPDATSAVVRILHNADCVALTNAQGQWRQLAEGGWIHNSQLIADDAAITTTANVAIRRTPECTGDIVARISDGSVLTVTGPGQNGWYPVSIGDYTGWSSAFHLRGPEVETLDHELCS